MFNSIKKAAAQVISEGESVSNSKLVQDIFGGVKDAVVLTGALVLGTSSLAVKAVASPFSKGKKDDAYTEALKLLTHEQQEALLHKLVAEADTEHLACLVKVMKQDKPAEDVAATPKSSKK